MIFYKLNPYLVIDFNEKEDNHILLNLLDSNRKFKFKGAVSTFMSFLKVARKWWTKEGIISEFSKSTKSSIQNWEFDTFRQMGVLISEDKYSEYRKEISIWLKYKWVSAMMCHIWTSKPWYIEPNSNDWIEKRHTVHKKYIDDWGLVNLYKECDSISKYSSDKILNLPKIDFLELIKSRKTVRNFNGEKVNKDLLFSILYYALFDVKKIREEVENYNADMNNLKKSQYTALEFYIVVFDVDWLEKWVYHFNIKNQTLDFIKSGDFRSEVKNIQMWQAVLDDAKYAMYVTADYSRQMWRYRYWHKLRLLLMQVWKIAQQVINISLAFDVWTFMSPAIKDSEAESLLWLNPDFEWCVYFMCFWKFDKDKSNSYYFNNLPKIKKNDR